MLVEFSVPLAISFGGGRGRGRGRGWNCNGSLVFRQWYSGSLLNPNPICLTNGLDRLAHLRLLTN